MAAFRTVVLRIKENRLGAKLVLMVGNSPKPEALVAGIIISRLYHLISVAYGALELSWNNIHNFR